ncbi:homoserine O-succinyltransferase [Parashewanella curva]|uniref:Homoserine O-succinyltransferase n=2 Tax=Parashewanella curva TaxID=2338552 RepID=A0A3L8Q3J9_9GAMM|nr:homoserine O-succinyltransferase [Parashewanella curva]
MHRDNRMTTAVLPSFFEASARIDSRGFFQLPEKHPLFHGGTVFHGQVSYYLRGPSLAPVIIVLGGISSGKETELWWPEMVGAGLAIDTDRYQVLSIDFLGGNHDSSGPDANEHSSQAAAIDTRDQAKAISLLLEHLNIDVVHNFIGASYGGMIALAFAELFPNKVKQLCILCAAHKSSNLGIAWRSIQRQIIQLGADTEQEEQAIALARALAMTTYRSFIEFEERFSTAPYVVDGYFQFPVNGYLTSRGEAFKKNFCCRAYLCLSESIDLHHILPENIKTPITCISFDTDQLIPKKLMQELAEYSQGKSQHFHLTSLYGHDAFLKETQAITPLIQQTLESNSHAQH